MSWEQLPSLFSISFSPSGTQGKEVEVVVGWEVLPTWWAIVLALLSLNFRSHLPLPAAFPLECSPSSPTWGEAPTTETRDTWVEAKLGPPGHLTSTGKTAESLRLLRLWCRSRRRVPHLETARLVPFPLTHTPPISSQTEGLAFASWNAAEAVSWCDSRTARMFQSDWRPT